MACVAAASGLVAAAADSRMAAPQLSGGRALAGAPLRPARQQQRQTRRRAASVQAVASPVKPVPKAGAKAPISSEEARKLYSDMILGREFEEMCAQMYYRGKMFGFVHLYSGQEAVSTGAPLPPLHPPSSHPAACLLLPGAC